MLKDVMPESLLEKALPATGGQPPIVRPAGKKDAQGRMYATGKRKTSIARVWVKPGSGSIMVGNRSIDDFFGWETLRLMVAQPFRSANRVGQYDVWCTVKGGGISGQAGAIRHGISKALSLLEPELRTTLKQADLLRRDDRQVERKKPGKRGARRGCQFKKR